MTFKPATWLPIAILLSAANLVAVGFAAGGTEPWHAGVHATLALGKLRRELSETQERLDFVERRLVQGSEARRVAPERG